MWLKSGTLLQGEKYKIIQVLGQGGFGITYLAEQPLMDRKVCIKEFFLKEYCDRADQTSEVSLGTTNNKALMQKYQEKFLKEARMIAKFDHPNIIKIHDVFTENNTAYYVMDYIDGVNLNDIVKVAGALSEEKALGYIREVGAGLAYVHAKNINHLDVKPGNIMVRNGDGRPVLIDFGMSKQYDEAGEQTSSTPIGVSAGYAPLEQYQVGGVSSFSPQTDVYSLAATLYRLLTGKVPPQASEIMNEGLPEMPSSISASTRAAIVKGMQFRKKDRPESVNEFLAMLSGKVSVDLSQSVEVVEDQSTVVLSDKVEKEVVQSAQSKVFVEATENASKNKVEKKKSSKSLFIFSCVSLGISVLGFFLTFEVDEDYILLMCIFGLTSLILLLTLHRKLKSQQLLQKRKKIVLIIMESFSSILFLLGSILGLPWLI